MARIDPERERQRLREVYSAMNDLELQKVGEDPAALTELALESLRGEMARRGIGRASKDMSVAEVPQAVTGNVVDSGDAPVVLQAFRDFPEALAARMTLESAGIECSLFDETFIRLDWLCSNALGGIKLVVRKSDADEALRILEEKAPENFDQAR